MNSHAHAILELPAPKEVSNFWDLNLSAFFSSQDFSRFTREREEREKMKMKINTLPCRLRIVLNLF
jgi:hypothetical protein